MRKRYAAEALGTFLIVFAPVALSAVARQTGHDPGLLIAALVSGLSVLGAIYALGPICGAHFNPAVTVAFAVVRRFPRRFVGPYVVAQLAGAVLASGLVALLFSPGAGAHVPATTAVQAVGVESVLSFILMLVIVAVATDRRVASAVPALAIGLTVVVDVLVGGPTSGGSMNPARSLGPALFAGGAALANLWVYVLGPAVGAALGALAFEAIRLDPADATGVPNELLTALRDVQAEG